MRTAQTGDLKRESTRLLLVAARLGYAAKGLVYTVVGALSLLYAFGEGGALTDSKGAVERLGAQPLGIVLLWLTAVGLACYALWNAVRALLNPERHDNDAKGAAHRLGLGFSALTHGALAVYAAQAAIGGARDSGNGTESWAARALSVPFGQVLLAIAGAIGIGFGAYQLYKAVKDKPEGKLATEQLSPREERVYRALGRLGQVGRGLVFPVIGVSLLIAAVRAQASEASNMGEALGELARAPLGGLVLIVVALGLFAYGVYQAVLARYAVLPAPR
jgi:glycerol uptake facilitator-like aquaporin